jgi:hypothetical protein
MLTAAMKEVFFVSVRTVYGVPMFSGKCNQIRSSQNDSIHRATKILTTSARSDPLDQTSCRLIRAAVEPPSILLMKSLQCTVPGNIEYTKNTALFVCLLLDFNNLHTNLTISSKLNLFIAAVTFKVHVYNQNWLLFDHLSSNFNDLQ